MPTVTCSELLIAEEFFTIFKKADQYNHGGTGKAGEEE
jgi:hypothetical protein